MFTCKTASARSIRSPAHILRNRAQCQRWITYNGKGSCSRKYTLVRRMITCSSVVFVSLVSKPLLLDEKIQPKKTFEESLLEVSERETFEEQQIPLNSSLLRKIVHAIKRLSYRWIYEPIATTFRFTHLLVIFIPVFVSIPVMYIGRRDQSRDNERSGTLWWYGFMIRSMERAGPTFIKLGQWAASRTDIFPTELCAMMSKLHSNNNGHSLSATKKIVELAFDGRKFNTIFEEFIEKPLGVGAIAQVYKARLKGDLLPPRLRGSKGKAEGQNTIRGKVGAFVKEGTIEVPSSYVAIKVLHPNVEQIVARDLKIMNLFANIISLIPSMEWLSLPDEVTQFGEMMQLQLDLRIEAKNLESFRERFEHRSSVAFPAPYTEYTTRKVLVEEFAHGLPLRAFLEKGAGVYHKELADMGLDAFLYMLLIDNFIHADLHPGNILVRFKKTPDFKIPGWKSHKDNDDASSIEDATESVATRLRPYIHNSTDWMKELSTLQAEGFVPQLIFIDTGLVTELNNVNRANFLDLFKAIAEFDGYKAGHLMVERCRQPNAVIDREIFALKMQHLVLSVKSQTFALGNVRIADILHEVLTMVRSHHVRMEGDFVNVVISILLLEGIGRQLDPDMDLFKSALPILRQLGAQGGTRMLQQSDSSMLKVWVALEARQLLSASIEDIESMVKYDLLSPNI